MWIFKTIDFLKWLIALILSVALFLAVSFLNATAFPFKGEKEYYLYSVSSQAQIKQAINPLEIPFICGESISIPNPSNEFLDGVLTRYRASIVKVEESEESGVVSYYCYSPKLKRGILIDGVFVNLHVVVKVECVVLGSPIIFGGY